jgi:hypothetical protein
MSARILSLDEAQERLGGVSRGKLYRMIGAGEVTRINLGTRAFITVESINRHLDRLIAEAEGGAA